MGGVGSGRPWRGGGKQTVENTPSIDINRLNQEGRLRPGLYSIALLSPRGSDVGIKAEIGDVCLYYRLQSTSGEWEVMRQTIEIARISCRFGGERPYFVCMCGRRAIKLYAGGRYFRCRRCRDLAHASQNEDGWGRARRRALKTKRRIGGDCDINGPLPFIKPKYMQQHTFSRLYRKADTAKKAAGAAFCAKAIRTFRLSWMCAQ